MAIEVVSQEEIDEQNEYINKLSSLVAGKKYYLMTMGCQLNENDSEKLAGMMTKMGYIETSNIEDADLVVFNTCCVRENAENKILGHLGILKSIKKHRKDMIIALGGCMAQEPNMIEKFKKNHGQHINIIFGTHNMYKFPELLYKAVMENKKITDIWEIDGNIVEGLPIKRESDVKASVTIMNGCNNFCSYCIVPYVRGRERSRTVEAIIKEIKALADDGVKEVTLCGQNVNSYGKDLTPSVTFAELLTEVTKVDGILRVRFVSPHPKDFSDELINVIKENEKVCKVIHLPLQSGSSKILKVMNRKYTKENYLALVEKIKNKIPKATFSTDIIVGFPGETEEDFLDTIDVVEKVKFDSAYTYVYSPRVGTPAATMDNQIPEEIKTDRIGRLIEVVNKGLEEQNEKLVNTIQKVLVEGKSKTDENMLTGRTDGGKIVNFEGDCSLIGKMLELKIEEQRKWYLKGKLL